MKVLVLLAGIKNVGDFQSEEILVDGFRARLATLEPAPEKIDAEAPLPLQGSPAVVPLAQVSPLSAFGGRSKLLSTNPRPHASANGPRACERLNP